MAGENTRITWLGQPTTYNVNSPKQGRIARRNGHLTIIPDNGTDHFLKDGVVYDYDLTAQPRVAENQGYWLQAFDQAQKNAQPNLMQKGVHWLGRKLGKAGNWLQNFQEGGAMGQQLDPEAVIQALHENPEETISALLELGEEGEQILSILSEDPELGSLIQQAKQNLGIEMDENGGTVKKAGCGCKATLRREGGRLISVDCNGNVIQKKKGGCVKKGLEGIPGGITKETFDSWLAANSPENRSYASRKKLAADLGIQNYSGTYNQNMQLWKLLRDKQSSATARQDAPAEPIQPQVQGVVVAEGPQLPTIVAQPAKADDIHPFANVYNFRKFAEDENFPLRKGEGENTTYYEGSYSVNPNTGETYSSTITPASNGKQGQEVLQEYSDWVKENIDNPQVLFDPKYKNTRQNLPSNIWRQILTKHPEYEVQHKNSIPTDIQSGRMQGAVNREMDEQGHKAATLYGAMLNPLAGMASVAGGVATDEAVRSNGKSNSWSEKINKEGWLGKKIQNMGDDNKYKQLAQNVYGTVTNPGAAAGAILGGITEGTASRNGHTQIAKINSVRQGTPSVVEFDLETVGGDLPKIGFKPGYSWMSRLTQEPRVIKPVEAAVSYGVPEQKWYPNNTAYDWGSPEFQKWWIENAPGNEGKILDFNGKLIKIGYDPNGYRVRNFQGGVNPGVYKQGSVSDRRVFNVSPIKYEGPRIGYQQVGVTPVQWNLSKPVYGNYETL